MKTTTVRIPQNLAAELRGEAKGAYRSLNAHVIALLSAGRSLRQSPRAPRGEKTVEAAK